MWRTMTLSTAAALALASCSSSETVPVERTVDLGTHGLSAVVSGAGAPAVVIDGGIGSPGAEYSRLRERLAAVTTTITYDRAGYGTSDAGPLPRDSATEASELRALLDGLDVDGPYVLVGHSLGGLNAQIFAAAHPDDVEGLVLLDPPPIGFLLGEAFPELATMASGMTDEWQALADRGARSENERERSRAAFFRMLASEHREMFAASARQARAAASFGDIPLVVVASGVPNPMFGDVAGRYQEYWAAASEALAKKSSRGRFVFAESSTHRLHEDAVDTVVDLVVEMVRSRRQQADRP